MSTAGETIRNDLRRSRRYELRLFAGVTILKGIKEDHSPAILAYARDVSRDGLCLIMSTSGDTCRDLEQENYNVKIALVLPDGIKVDLVGSSIYCNPQKGDDLDVEYLVGVKLKALADVAIYREFVASLAERQEFIS